MNAHLLFIGGEDHHLRIPFFLALREKGFQVSAAANCEPGPFERESIPFHRFAFSRFVDPAADLRAIAELRRVLSEADSDLAHCFDTKLTLLTPFAAGSRRRTKIVRTINGRGWIYSSKSFSARSLRFVYPRLHRMVAPFVSATVFEHGEDEAYFVDRGLLKNGKSVVIKGAGLDCDRFVEAAALGPSRADMRRSMGLENCEIVSTVTRVTREKGVPALLDAAARVHEARPSVRFLLIGPRDSEGPFGVTDAELAPHAGYVIATGPRTDVPSLLKMSDVFAFPSEYAGGNPRAVLEAALIGLPIVATDLPGCRSAIKNGWNGFLTPPGDSATLAARILELLANPNAAAEMGARGPAVAAGEFSLKEIASRHAELYESLLASPRSVQPKQNPGVFQPKKSMLKAGGATSPWR